MQVLNLEIAAACIEYNILKDISTFLWGPPGIGKSQVVRQIAKRLGINLIDIRLSLRDPVDLRGLPYIDFKTGVTIWLPPSELPNVKKHGAKGILFLDEINIAAAAMQGAAMGLVLDRVLGEYKLPTGWVPIAAGNRLSDKAFAQRTGTASNNRFSHFEVGPDYQTWHNHAVCNPDKFHPLVIAFLKIRPNLLHIMPKNDEKAFPTPRSWETVCKYAEAPERIRQKLVASVVGEGPAAEFEGYARVWDKLPDINEIFKAPKRAKVPQNDEPSVFYMITLAIAAHCTKDNFANAIEYSNRLPKEFGVTTVVEAVKRDPTLKKTNAYSKWIVNNEKVFA